MQTTTDVLAMACRLCRWCAAGRLAGGFV